MYKNVIKRMLDIIIAITALPFLGIIYVIIGVLIKLEDKGRVFFISDRLGKKGKIYKMYKFRTMKENVADIRNSDGSTYNGEEDNRVTKIGKVLRKTSLDEIPQIINVLIGNMSIVGPRPDLPEHYKLYTENEKQKLTVLPGITGYNQAYFRNSIEWKKRLENDIYYVENINFILDIRIIFRTIYSVLKKEKIYIQVDENKKESEDNE